MAGGRSAVITSGVVLAATALALGGCGSDSPHAHGSHSADPSPAARSAPVVQGGAPGESAQTVSPSAVTDPWNETDAEFMTMMIPHHAQALEMTRLAQKHAVDPEIVSLAERIESAQGPEIVAMSAWLDARGQRVPRASDPEHTMAGMLTAAQMSDLGEARGKEFDRLFLTGMIQHHRGALKMAEPMAATGSDARAIEMALDVETTQSVEIEIMEKMLAKL